MSDSISMIADEIMQQVLYGATVDWRPNMAQIAQRLRELASLRQVPDGLKRDHYLAAWEAARSLQHIAGMAHVGKAWKDMAASAAHGVYAVFGEAVGADWHSRTPWLNPSPPTSGAESIPSGIYWNNRMGNFYRMSDRKGQGIAFHDAWFERRNEFPQSPDEPTPAQAVPTTFAGEGVVPAWKDDNAQAVAVDPDSASFKEGFAVGRAESEMMCGLLKDPRCSTCGARNAKEAETMCRPSGDSCPGSEWPLSNIWDLSAATPAQAGAELPELAFWRDVYERTAFLLYRKAGHAIMAAEDMAKADLESREREYAAIARRGGSDE